MMVSLSILLGLLTVCIYLFGLYARTRSKWKDIQDALLEEFYAAAGKLIDDDRVPDRVAAGFIRMVGDVYSPRFCRRMARDLLFRRRPSEVTMKCLRNDLNGVPQELRPVLAQALVFFCFASTFNSLLAGILLRRMFFVSVPSRSEARRTNLDDDRFQVMSGEVFERIGPGLATPC